MRKMINNDNNVFFAYTPTSEKKKSIAIINSIIVTYSGGVKQQGRAANRISVLKSSSHPEVTEI